MESFLKNSFKFSLAFVSVVIAILGCAIPQEFQPTPTQMILPTQIIQPTRVILPTQVESPTQTIVPTQVVRDEQKPTQITPTNPIATQELPTPAQVSNSGGLDGKALFQERCTGCHGLGPIVRHRYSASDWKYIVDFMINQGALLNVDEEAAVVKYLSNNFGQ